MIILVDFIVRTFEFWIFGIQFLEIFAPVKLMHNYISSECRVSD